jgi:glucosyl-dolichyl phosphate glucuronosyltransferase
VILAPKISILIPTHNRAASLKRLLDSLEASAGLEEIPLEIIVVNNHSTDATSQILMEVLSEDRKFQIIVLEQLKHGKSWALNLGLAHAAGSLILLLDDDVSVDKFCVAEHVAAYKDGLFEAIQGKVLAGLDPQGQSANMARLREYNIPLVDYGDASCEVRGFIGTNISLKREIFEKAGLFDTRLGPGASGFSEDTEYSRRIRESGFKIGYAPKAIIYHELNPKRYGRSYNRNVQYRKGLSRSIYRKDSLIFRALPDLIGNCFRYLAYTATGRRQKAYKTQGRIAKSYGYIAGKVQNRVLQHRRTRS